MVEIVIQPERWFKVVCKQSVAKICNNSLHGLTLLMTHKFVIRKQW